MRLLASRSLTGALNILVPAAVDWYREGLLKPSTLMQRARDEFLGENDWLGDFLTERYEFGDGDDFVVKRKDLIEDLRDQCADSARFRDSDLVGMITKVEGITYTKATGNVNIFRGIKKLKRS